MSKDLIFHVASKRKWRDRIERGQYKADPETDDTGVLCVGAQHLRSYVNSKFSDRKKAMLLVIDKARVVNPIQQDKETGIYIIEEGLNTDAILDRITLTQNEEGLYDIEIEE
jgi:uncharacterized protein (DUF952 family)